MQTKLRVLFLQSQGKVWSMETVHRLVLQNFDRDRVEMHMACATGPGGTHTPAYTLFEPVPDLHLRPTNFGRPISGAPTKWRTFQAVAATGVAVPATLIGLMNYVKRNRIDILHVPENPRDAVWSAFLRRATGVKNVIHLHGSCADWMRPAFLRAMREADGVIGVSKFSANSAIRIGCKPDRVYHALNGVDYRQWDYEMDGSLIRREFAIPRDALVFTLVGSVVPWKGHQRALEAFAQIRDRLPDFRFLIVGGDTSTPVPGYVSYLAYIKDKVHALGLDEEVIFTGMRSDVPAILAASDVYTMPSTEDACGLGILEAMAMKKAIVALESGGPPEFLEHGKSGLLSQPDDVGQLAENILTLATDAQLRAKMAEHGRRQIEQYLNAGRQANEIEEIYRRVLARPDPPDGYAAN